MTPTQYTLHKIWGSRPQPHRIDAPARVLMIRSQQTTNIPYTVPEKAFIQGSTKGHSK